MEAQISMIAYISVFRTPKYAALRSKDVVPPETNLYLGLYNIHRRTQNG